MTPIATLFLGGAPLTTGFVPCQGTNRTRNTIPSEVRLTIRQTGRPTAGSGRPARSTQNSGQIPLWSNLSRRPAARSGRAGRLPTSSLDAWIWPPGKAVVAVRAAGTSRKPTRGYTGLKPILGPRTWEAWGVRPRSARGGRQGSSGGSAAVGSGRGRPVAGVLFRGGWILAVSASSRQKRPLLFPGPMFAPVTPGEILRGRYESRAWRGSSDFNGYTDFDDFEDYTGCANYTGCARGAALSPLR